jgi:hypothetical protein
VTGQVGTIASGGGDRQAVMHAYGTEQPVSGAVRAKVMYDQLAIGLLPSRIWQGDALQTRAARRRSIRISELHPAGWVESRLLSASYRNSGGMGRIGKQQEAVGRNTSQKRVGRSAARREAGCNRIRRRQAGSHGERIRSSLAKRGDPGNSDTSLQSLAPSRWRRSIRCDRTMRDLHLRNLRSRTRWSQAQARQSYTTVPESGKIPSLRWRKDRDAQAPCLASVVCCLAVTWCDLA